MPEYDGTYTLGVEIDTTQAKKELDNLAKDTTKSINKGGNVIEPTVDTKKLNAQVKKGLSQEPIDVKMNPQLVFGEKARKSQAEQQKTIDQIRKQEAALQSLDRAYMVSSQQSQLAIDTQRKKVEEYRNTITSIKNDITYWAYNNSKDFKQVFDTYAQYENQLIGLEEKAEGLRSALAIHPEHELTKRELRDVEKEIDRIEGLSLDVTQQLNKWRTNPKLLPEVKKIYDTAEDETKKLEVMQDKATKGQGDYQAKRQGILDVIQSLTDTLTKQKGKAALAGENTVVGQILGLIKDSNGKGIKSIIDGISTALVALPEPLTTTIGLVLKLAGVLGIITAALNVVKKILDGIFGVIKKIIGIALQLVKNALGKVLAKFKELTKRTNLFGTIFQRMFRKISTSLKRRLFYGVITRAIGNLRNALVNLIKTDDEVKKSIGQTKGNLMTAFAPIYSFILPAIQRLMSALVQLSAMLARITSGLFGKTTKQSAELAKSLEEQAKAGKSASQSLASFDELNVINSDTGSDIEPIYDMMNDLFKNSQLEQYVKRLKGILADIWEPFKKSWDKYAAPTWELAKSTFFDVLDLLLDIGETFGNVWNEGGYGEVILDNLWKSLQNIIGAVDNLTLAIDDAWSNHGEAIITNLLNNLGVITSHIESITGKFKEWTGQLDFNPLLNGISQVTEKLAPLSDEIGKGLEQFLDDVLFPFGDWLIEKGIPAVLQLVADNIEHIKDNLDVFNQVMKWAWDEYLQPFVDQLGQDIIDTLDEIHDVLTITDDDIDDTNNKVKALKVAIVFLKTWFEKLGETLAILGGGPIAVFIGVLKNLREFILKVRDVISLVAIAFGDWDSAMDLLGRTIERIFGKLVDWLEKANPILATLLNGIGKLAGFDFSNVDITGSLRQDIDLLSATKEQSHSPNKYISAAADAVLKYGSGSTTPIVRGTSSTNGASGMPSSIQQLMKKKGLAFASGTVIPPSVAPFMAMLGDNRQETEVVSPLSTMKQAVIEAMNESDFGGNGIFHIHVDVDGREIANAMVQQNDIYRRRTGRSLLV